MKLKKFKIKNIYIYLFLSIIIFIHSSFFYVNFLISLGFHLTRSGTAAAGCRYCLLAYANGRSSDFTSMRSFTIWDLFLSFTTLRYCFLSLFMAASAICFSPILQFCLNFSDFRISKFSFKSSNLKFSISLCLRERIFFYYSVFWTFFSIFFHFWFIYWAISRFSWATFLIFESIFYFFSIFFSAWSSAIAIASFSYFFWFLTMSLCLRR